MTDFSSLTERYSGYKASVTYRGKVPTVVVKRRNAKVDLEMPIGSTMSELYECAESLILNFKDAYDG